MSKEMFCLRCGCLGTPRQSTSGALIVEIALWCFFFVPGVIYSLWRLTSRQVQCRACNGLGTLILADLPNARRAMGKPAVPTLAEDMERIFAKARK